MEMEITCIKGDTIFVEGKPLLKILGISDEFIQLLCPSKDLPPHSTTTPHTPFTQVKKEPECK